jgi:hypothetical protein
MSKPELPDLSGFLNEDGEVISTSSLQTLTNPERFCGLVKAGKVDSLLVKFHAEKERFIQLEWLQEVLEIQTYNDEQELIDGTETGLLDVDENPILHEAEYQEYPTQPVAETFEDWQALKTPEYQSNKKLNGFDFNGVQVSLSLENQSGIIDLDYAQKITEAAGGTLFPLNFKTQTPKGFEIIPFATAADFTVFAMAFLPKRAALF